MLKNKTTLLSLDELDNAYCGRIIDGRLLKGKFINYIDTVEYNNCKVAYGFIADIIEDSAAFIGLSKQNGNNTILLNGFRYIGPNNYSITVYLKPFDWNSKP